MSQRAAAAKKRLRAFKARSCPTLNMDPRDIPPIVPKIAIFLLGTIYNILMTILSTHNPSSPGKGTFLRGAFIFVYLGASILLVYLIGSSKGQRRICGLWLGPKHFMTFLSLLAAVQLLVVIIMFAIVYTDDTYDDWTCRNYCKATRYDSFPWLTTVSGILLLFLAWAARSEPELLDESEEGDGREGTSDGLPAYSLINDSDTTVGV
ncbi:hypothetical protein V8F33_004741 [Rhypophila sp. PSN 637]